MLKGLSPHAGHVIYVIGPNSDSGCDLFREKLLAFAGEHPHIHYFPSIPDDQFLFLLGQIDPMIGNRQHGREAADNVVSIPFDADRIEQTAHPEKELAEQLARFKRCPAFGPS